MVAGGAPFSTTASSTEESEELDSTEADLRVRLPLPDLGDLPVGFAGALTLRESAFSAKSFFEVPLTTGAGSATVIEPLAALVGWLAVGG